MDPGLEWKLLDLTAALTRSRSREDGEKGRILLGWFAPPGESHFRGGCAHAFYEAALRLESEQGPGAEVFALYEKALQYGESSDRSIVAGSHHRLGICHEHAGRYREAMEEYSLVLRDAEVWPADTADARWRLAGLLLHAERPEEALAHLRALDGAAQEGDELALERGIAIARCCLETRRFDEGLRKLDECLSRAPRDKMTELMLLKSELAEKAGRMSEARACLEKALAEAHDSPVLRMAIHARLMAISPKRSR